MDASGPSLPCRGQRQVVEGRYFDAGHVAREDKVVVLGQHAAKILGITRLTGRRPSSSAPRHTPSCIGVLGDLKREKSLASAVLLPPAVGKRYGLSSVPGSWSTPASAPPD